MTAKCATSLETVTALLLLTQSTGRRAAAGRETVRGKGKGQGMEAPASPLGELSEAAWTAIEESTAPAPEKIAALRSLIGNGATKQLPLHALPAEARPFSPTAPPPQNCPQRTFRRTRCASRSWR
jgi:hypothetical protein